MLSFISSLSAPPPPTLLTCLVYSSCIYDALSALASCPPAWCSNNLPLYLATTPTFNPSHLAATDSVRYDGRIVSKIGSSLSRFPGARESTELPNVDISRVGARIIDELVRAMRDIDLDDVELACVKALVFFDPSKCSRWPAISNLRIRFISFLQMPKDWASRIASTGSVARS